MMQMLDKLYLSLMVNFMTFVEDEKGAVGLVTIVVLIGIAVVLAIFFREKIQELLESLFGTISGNATSAINK